MSDALREALYQARGALCNIVSPQTVRAVVETIDAALRSVPAPQEAPKSDALREALNRLVDIAEAYSADQSNAPHPMCANIQPVTVAEATELNEALQQARAALRSGDGWTRVEDGLPPKSGSYLLCTNGNVALWYLTAGVTLSPYVTHWRPLPPAPEDRT